MPQSCHPVKELVAAYEEWRETDRRLLAIASGCCSPSLLAIFEGILGAVAQLGERCVRNAEVEGSTPFRSTSRNPLTVDVSGLFCWTPATVAACQSRSIVFDSR